MAALNEWHAASMCEIQLITLTDQGTLLVDIHGCQTGTTYALAALLY